jgi:hypothetical protein
MFYNQKLKTATFIKRFFKEQLSMSLSASAEELHTT